MDVIFDGYFTRLDFVATIFCDDHIKRLKYKNKIYSRDIHYYTHTHVPMTDSTVLLPGQNGVAFAFIVDKVVGEELSEPILEAKLDVILEVKLEARGFTAENTELCVFRGNTRRDLVTAQTI